MNTRKKPKRPANLLPITETSAPLSTDLKEPDWSRIESAQQQTSRAAAWWASASVIAVLLLIVLLVSGLTKVTQLRENELRLRTALEAYQKQIHKVSTADRKQFESLLKETDQNSADLVAVIQQIKQISGENSRSYIATAKAVDLSRLTHSATLQSQQHVTSIAVAMSGFTNLDLSPPELAVDRDPPPPPSGIDIEPIMRGVKFDPKRNPSWWGEGRHLNLVEFYYHKSNEAFGAGLQGYLRKLGAFVPDPSPREKLWDSTKTHIHFYYPDDKPLADNVAREIVKFASQRHIQLHLDGPRMAEVKLNSVQLGQVAVWLEKVADPVADR